MKRKTNKPTPASKSKSTTVKQSRAKPVVKSSLATKAKAAGAPKAALAKASSAPAVKKSAVVSASSLKKAPVKPGQTNLTPKPKTNLKVVTAVQTEPSKMSAKSSARQKPAVTAKALGAKPAVHVATPTAPVAVKLAPKVTVTATTAAKSAAPVPPKAAAATAPKPVQHAPKAAPMAPARSTSTVAPPTSNGARPAAPAAPIRPAIAPAQKAPIAAPMAVSAPSEPKKPVGARHGFKTGEWIVYPAQGVGQIVAIEEQEIAGMKLELFVIVFEKDKMTLRVPTGKAATVGMRKLAEDGVVKRAMETLKGRARIKRTMWSRRAQEFEAKINSGDLVSVAEVVRDLYRAESQPEQSYSERLLFERALDRMARELAAVDKLDERGAAQRIVDVLSKSAKARRPAGETVVDEPADDNGDDANAAA